MKVRDTITNRMNSTRMTPVLVNKPAQLQLQVPIPPNSPITIFLPSPYISKLYECTRLVDWTPVYIKANTLRFLPSPMGKDEDMD